MIERIKLLQEAKIDELLASVDVNGRREEYVVKAPTGSGKTYMQGYLISKLLKQHPNAIVLYQSLSKARLANQAFNKIVKQYKFRDINAYLINTEFTVEERPSIPTNYNTYFLPKDLFKKDGNIQKPLKDLLTYQTRGKEKFLIIDEGHIASKNINKYADEFDKIFLFSATPSKKQLIPNCFVVLEEKKCEKKHY